MTKKQLLLVIVFVFISPTLFAAEIDKAFISKITLEQGEESLGIKSHPFKESVMLNVVNSVSKKLDHDQAIRVFNEDKSWQALEGEATGTHLLRFSISANQFTTGKITVNGAQHASLFLNASHVSGNKEFSIELLNQDYRVLLVISGVEQWRDFSVEWTPDSSNEIESKALSFANDRGKKRASMKHYYDSQTVGTLNLSPNGKWLVWSKSHYSDLGGDTAHQLVEIIALDSQEVVYRWQGMNPRYVTWRDDSEALVFMHDNALYQLDIESKALHELATDLKDVRSLDWLSNNELVLSWHKSEDKPHPFTKRYRALQDRWSYWRGNSQVHKFDIQSGLFKQITLDSLSTFLLDIDSENRKALVSRSPIDYAEPPHGLTQLFELDLDTGEEQKLGEFRTFNSSQYHNKGILIGAGPSFVKDSGVNLQNEPVPNDYDGQLYLMTKEGEIKALSKSFNPAIQQAEVLENGDIVVSVSDQDRRQLYLYDFSKEAFSLINTKVDIVSEFSLSASKRPALVYKGSKATRPQSVYATNLQAKKQQLLFDSASEDFANIDFIDIKDWDYTSESGQLIDGRVYYPSNFDDNKSYPAIVYYYGGTAPVTRSFTGRWPFSLWASKGYVVYVLQPSGTPGYGQDYSARHVNAWGIHTADEIMESTQAFVKAHPFVDENRLGNMGASYGGFMTMYLSTKTDMFAASISHAGISNLTSYWGEGWWGYGYSGVATRGSFPWNQAKFYVEQSPVFAADKVTTPLLLLHGDADTNVPVGESHQMYTALKLLGKDVELIEFQGDDHHINSRERRLRWWSTILAYFDMKLKDEPAWWEHLYPPIDGESEK